MAIAGALIFGIAAGWLFDRNDHAITAEPDQPIQWNAVQSVPTRTPDAQDIAWEKRAQDNDISSTSSVQPDLETGSWAVANAPQVAKQTFYALDGDTFEMGGQRIRIARIDAPELHPSRCAEEQRLGLAAKAKLGALLNSGNVTMSGSGHDQYGRELRDVQINGQDVSEAMIGAGFARRYDGKKRLPWC